jgi:transcriptional regulator with XRE-family HTH domain
MSTKWFMPAPAASGPLYELRRDRGLSRRELAERSGVALRTIARIERGDGGPPYRSTLLALARALGVSTEALRA